MKTAIITFTDPLHLDQSGVSYEIAFGAGVDGRDGKSATIQIGTVSTGAPGTPAQVTNAGTENAAIFDFVIPQGADGQNGTDGKDGAPGKDGKSATVTVGTVTTGGPGSQAAVTNSGTENAAVLDFVIPQGPAGTNGTNGADGKSAYQSAQDGGFTGTEAEFNQQLASIGNINAVLDEINGEVI